MDVAMSAAPQPSVRRPVHDVGHWAAYVQLDWPVGVDQHPNVGRHLMRKLDRVCAIDHQSERLGLTYALRGERPEDAEADASELLDDVLEWLGLGHAAVANCTLLSLDQPQVASSESAPSI